MEIPEQISIPPQPPKYVPKLVKEENESLKNIEKELHEIAKELKILNQILRRI